MRLRSLLYVELTKLRRQRLAVTTVIAPLLVGLLLPQLIWLFGGPRATPARGFYVFAWSLELALLMGVYLLLLQAALSIVVDRHDKTLRNLLVAPVWRGRIIAVRWLALQGIALLLLALLAAGVFLSTAIHFEFGEIYEEAIEPLATVEELRTYTLIGLAKLILPLAAVVSVGVLVSVLTVAPATAAGVALGLLLLLDIVKSIASANSSFRLWLFNSYLPTLFDDSSYWNGVTAYAQGITDVLWMADAPEHGYGIFIPLGTVVVCFGLSLFVFLRGEYSE